MHTYIWFYPFAAFHSKVPITKKYTPDICNKEVNFFVFSINTLATTSTQIQDHETEKEELKDHLQEWKWKSFSPVWLFATPWTVALQAPLSMEFSRQEYWSGLHTLLQDLSSWPRDGTSVFCIAGRFFTTEPLTRPSYWVYVSKLLYLLSLFIHLFTRKYKCSWLKLFKMKIR